jgi:hypothetical protein
LFAALFGSVFAAGYAQAQVAALAAPPQVELFGGYSYVRANTVISGTRFSLQGASLSAAFSLNNWLGLVATFGFYHQGNIAASSFSLNLQTYQFGPRVSWRNQTRLTPFGEFLLGAGNAAGTLYMRPLGYGMTPLGPNNSLLLTAGGGADWRLGPRVKIRLVHAECLQSHFLNGDGNGNQQMNLKLSSGIVVSFGRD